MKSWGKRVAGAIFAVGVASCGASGDGLASEPCPIDTPGCVPRLDAGSSEDGPSQPTGDAVASDAAVTRSPLCGVVGCFPGNPSACGATPEGDSSAPADVGSDGSDDAASDGAPMDRTTARLIESGPSESGPIGSDSADDDARADASLVPDVSVDAIADAPGAPRDVGVNDEPKVQRSCYVRPTEAIPGSRVTTECAAVGQGEPGSACDDSSDCGALLACVDVGGNPVCRKFSCALPTSCSSGSYYQVEPLRVHGATMSDLKVPVCLPTDHCDFTAKPTTCPAGRICAIVGSEGDTTCVVPGTAKLGDSCDDLNYCAEGLVCSKLKNQCLKLCRTSAGLGMADCPGGTCQGGNLSLPDGFGICVGTNPDGG